MIMGGTSMKRLTVGQMAELNDISKQTLRYYDRIKLFEPSIVDRDNGYRYYTIRQSAYLDMIQYMKALGMDLKEIKKHMEERDLSLVKDVLGRRISQIDAQLGTLQYQRRAIERTLMGFSRYESSPPDGTIVLEYINDRLMYCIDTDINFYDYGIEVYEEMLRKLKASMISDDIPQIYFCNAGTIMRKMNLERRRFYSTEVFVFVDRDSVPECLTTEIPAGTYLCIYCDRFGKEKEYIGRLLDSIRDSNYSVAGDYVCEVVAELPFPETDERGMFLKLQIPVKFS